MKIVFFDVQEWEKDSFQAKFPDAVLVEAPINFKNVSAYTDAEIISSMTFSVLDSQVLSQLPNLKHIASRSTGYDYIDLSFAKNKNISVSYIPEYGSNTVAEHAFALILALTRKVYQAINQMKDFNFDHTKLTGVDIYGKTLGIIGLGKIGINVLRIANSFGMKVLVFTKTQREDLRQKFDFEYVPLDELLRESDIITVHVPLNPETKHMINKNNILSLKKGSYLINTARGEIIETGAIILGLEKGILEGVGLDVLEKEKELTEEVSVLASKLHAEDFKNLMMNHVLINHPKVLITPHNAFNSKEALQRIIDETIENIEGFLKGSPKNLV
ncbi:MAG: NAD(P)-dependent oxidoreductase [Patescibacteria group bacterium]